jgi:hypothetical protein
MRMVIMSSDFAGDGDFDNNHANEIGGVTVALLLQNPCRNDRRRLRW